MSTPYEPKKSQRHTPAIPHGKGYDASGQSVAPPPDASDAPDGDAWLAKVLAEDPCGDHRFDNVPTANVLSCLADLLRGYAPSAHHWGIQQAIWRLHRLSADPPERGEGEELTEDEVRAIQSCIALIDPRAIAPDLLRLAVDAQPKLWQARRLRKVLEEISIAPCLTMLLGEDDCPGCPGCRARKALAGGGP